MTFNGPGFEIVTDPDADPTDLDSALAEFLLRFVQRKPSTSAGTSAADRSISFTEELKGR